MIDKLWPELRNFNPEIMSTFKHYSTEIIGPLVIKNVYWKFELETKNPLNGWGVVAIIDLSSISEAV